jgi:[acyl-carrier-protein] S-malonyltransferase
LVFKKSNSLKKIALLFPGQGAQHVGMGKELFQVFRSFKDVIQRAEDAASLHISKLMFEGPEHLLTDTENAQPCLVAASIATLAVMRESIPEFSFHSAAGHSLGEYSALVSIGALDFETAIKLVAARGKLMKTASAEGGMVAIIGLDRETLQQCCNEQCVIANDNCPGQLVISGLPLGLTDTMEKAKKAGAKMIKKLPVSGPFHSPWMADAQERMKEILSATLVNPFTIPYYPNTQAVPTIDESCVVQLLLNQITGPVRFRETLLHMASSEVTHFFEVGPGQVLSGLAKRTCPTILCQTIHTGYDVEAIASQ